MEAARIVIDTNVIVSAVRSRRGASFRLISEVGRGKFEMVLSVPLLLEYEQALMERRPPSFSAEDVEAILDYLCQAAHHQEIFYLWRPLLRDPKDDLVLEVAVAGQCRTIVTYNGRDFRAAEQFGLAIITPLVLLRQIGVVT